MTTTSQPAKWRVSPLTLAILGYGALALAMILVGRGAGYSDDDLDRFFGHILAQSLAGYWAILLANRYLARFPSMFKSLADSEKGQFGAFLLIFSIGCIGLISIARHADLAKSEWLVGSLSFMIAFSMAQEHSFLLNRCLIAERTTQVGNA